MKITLEEFLKMTAKSTDQNTNEQINLELQELAKKHELEICALVFTKAEQLNVVCDRGVARHEMIGLLDCALETVRGQ